jgi:hypothetical protein
MPVDTKLGFRPAEAPAAPAAKRGAPPEQPERPQLPFDVPVTRREAPRVQPERPSEKTPRPRKWNLRHGPGFVGRCLPCCRSP